MTQLGNALSARRTEWPPRRGGGLRADIVVLAAATLAVLLVAATTTAAVGLVAVVLGLVLVGGVFVPRRYRFGTFVGLCVLGGLDALPGPDLTTLRIKFGFNAQDLVVAVLCVCLFVDNLRHGFGGILDGRLGRLLALWSLALTTWWLITLLRTAIEQTVPVLYAANVGHDLLSFGLMIPLFAGTLQRPQVRSPMLLAVACGSAVQMLVYVALTASHRALPSLLHVSATGEVNGLTRLYSPVGDLFPVAFTLGAGALLLCPVRRIRVLGAAVGVLGLAAIAAGQTRAEYVGVAVGIIAAVIVWLSWPGNAARAGRRRALATVVVAGAAIALVVIYSPNGEGAHLLSAAGSRIASISSTATSSNTRQSTVAVRLVEASLIEQQLSGHELVGLGFLDPTYEYFVALPNGSIRNPDVGLLNVTATMGIIGTVLYYLAIVGVTLGLIVRARSLRNGSYGWLGLGVFAWCITALVTSITLVTLFSPTGVVTSAAMLGLGVVVLMAPSAPSRRRSVRL